MLQPLFVEDRIRKGGGVRGDGAAQMEEAEGRGSKNAIYEIFYPKNIKILINTTYQTSIYNFRRCFSDINIF